MLDSERFCRFGPSGFQIDLPAVRIRPRGQVALTRAGRTLVGLRGLAEDRVRGVAPMLVERSRLAVSAAIRSSSPHRGPASVDTGHASRSLARPFRAHAGGSTPASRPDGTLLGFPPLQRLRSRRSGSTRTFRCVCRLRDAGIPHPPPSVLGVSHALDGLLPATPSGSVSPR
jgi:hypothetical protein